MGRIVCTASTRRPRPRRAAPQACTLVLCGGRRREGAAAAAITAATAARTLRSTFTSPRLASPRLAVRERPLAPRGPRACAPPRAPRPSEARRPPRRRAATRGRAPSQAKRRSTSAQSSPTCQASSLRLRHTFVRNTPTDKGRWSVNRARTRCHSNYLLVNIILKPFKF